VLAELLLTTDTVADLLQEVVALAAATVPDGAASITMPGRHGESTVVHSGDVAAQLDEVQYGLGGGPCLLALSSGEEIDVPDARAETRWPDYAAMLVGNGVLSCHSLPLQVRNETLGALNLYSQRLGAFAEHVLSAARTVAAEGAFALVVTRRYAEKAELSEQLGAALTSRSVIDQALGIIIGQNHVDADEAFAVLRRISQNRNVKLRDVAAQMIAGYSAASPAPSAPTPRPPRVPHPGPMPGPGPGPGRR